MPCFGAKVNCMLSKSSSGGLIDYVNDVYFGAWRLPRPRDTEVGSE